MAINNGNVLDPSRRIRATLGEEFTANVEADALSRIVSQAELGSGQRTKTTGPVRNEVDMSDYMSRIVHTNERKQYGEPTSNNFVMSLELRKAAFDKTVEGFKGMSLSNKSVLGKVFTGATGFDKSISRAENITNLGCTLVNIASGVGIQSIVDGYLGKQENRTAKNIVGLGCLSVIIDFGTSYGFAGNKDTVEGLFDPNNISSAEANIINKAIEKEKLKYAAEHTAFGFVAPFVASNLLSKALSEKAKENKVVQTATSFGVLSSLGKIALQGVRVLKDTKDIKAIDGCVFAITENQPCESYETVAKYAMRRSINNKIDASIYGNIGGLVGNAVIKSIQNKYAVVENKPTIGFKPVEVNEKPVNTEPVVVTTTKSTTVKKESSKNTKVSA